MGKQKLATGASIGQVLAMGFATNTNQADQFSRKSVTTK
jgi:hypothetical protein